jgi:hypothetical protein
MIPLYSFLFSRFISKSLFALKYIILIIKIIIAGNVK